VEPTLTRVTLARFGGRPARRDLWTRRPIATGSGVALRHRVTCSAVPDSQQYHPPTSG
jgi:hypothetical protein